LLAIVLYSIFSLTNFAFAVVAPDFPAQMFVGVV